jgi:hypothetical protein
MIRYGKVHDEVLKLYCNMNPLVFPIQPEEAMRAVPNCRMMTYREFSALNNCSVEETVRLCSSKSGCTQYDVLRNRHLILWNDDPSDNNVLGRQRWTKAHELGHVVLRHLPQTARSRSEPSGFYAEHCKEYEDEADLFASILLCPWPLFFQLHIHSAADVANVFGLSTEASNVRWADYLRWMGCKRNDKELRWAGWMEGLYQLRKKSGMVEHPPFHYGGKLRSGIDVWPDKASGDP